MAIGGVITRVWFVFGLSLVVLWSVFGLSMVVLWLVEGSSGWLVGFVCLVRLSVLRGKSGCRVLFV